VTVHGGRLRKAQRASDAVERRAAVAAAQTAALPDPVLPRPSGSSRS